jgi:hypothetical protein
VCGLTGLVAIPVAFALIRRAEIAKAVTSTQQRDVAVAGSPDPVGAAAK